MHSFHVFSRHFVTFIFFTYNSSEYLDNFRQKNKSEIRIEMHSYTTEAFKIAHQRYTLTCPCFICSFQRLAGAKTFYQAQ